MTVDRERAGQRVDNFLMAHLKGLPRSRIYRMLRKGEVRVNGGRSRPGARLQAGDRVRLPPVSGGAIGDSSTVPRKLRNRVAGAFIYEDSDLAVLDKPSGLAVHSGTGIPFGIIEVLGALRPETEWGLAHRLDRGTSGCLVVGKGPGPTRALQAAFREDRVDKAYLALLRGEWHGGETEVTAPLRRLRDEPRGETMTVDSADGQPASTRFLALRMLPGYTLVRAQPRTGRTHQIRVHARELGHPVAGDPVYGNGAAAGTAGRTGPRRIFLHSAEISFAHPTSGETMNLGASLPPDLKGFLDGLSGESRQDEPQP